MRDVVPCASQPDNVGYDEDGTVKLFDFGLAQFQKTYEKGEKAEMAGSLRYMAPENGLRRGCDVSSDVYSFGILLWELCTLKKPFNQLKTAVDFMDKVFVGDLRPSCKGLVTKSGRGLLVLLKQCWDKDKSIRPSIDSIVKTRIPKILDELNDMLENRNNGANDSFRRSAPRRRPTFSSSRSTSSVSSDDSANEKDGKPGLINRQTEKKVRRRRTTNRVGIKVTRTKSMDDDESRPQDAPSLGRRGRLARAKSFSSSLRRLLSGTRPNSSSHRGRIMEEDKVPTPGEANDTEYGGSISIRERFASSCLHLKWNHVG